KKKMPQQPDVGIFVPPKSPKGIWGLMTFKALAHICILGCTWGLGFLQSRGNNGVVAFIFTIINSLQGAFIFLVHCVLNRQVLGRGPRRCLGVWQETTRTSVPFLPCFCPILFSFHPNMAPFCPQEGERPQSHKQVPPRTDPFLAHPTHFQQLSGASNPFPAYFLQIQPIFPVFLLI
uniref:Uncharacterized protein n=1 Tax=Strix occidentalis caurina TaxID=311401 RepID=A0A8D0F8K9_STROC